MKVLILSNVNSIHTKRWVTSLAEKGIIIYLFSLENRNGSIEYTEVANLSIIECSLKSDVVRKNGKISKLALIKYLPKLKEVLRNFKPDILHAHYATSYGLLGSLSAYKPFVLSVWGSDIYDFPQISLLHRKLIEFNLSKADKILSTSHVMATETRKYTSKEIEVTPFGIDLEKFKNFPVENLFEPDAIVIGTVKALYFKYGINYLIKAFKLLKSKNENLILKLLIIGDGEDKLKLETLAKELDISADIYFAGNIDNEIVPKYLNMMDIYVALSTLHSESFGVAIIEASACERPVVVSDKGGLPEVVSDSETGFVVESKNPKAAAEALDQLVHNSQLRNQMGKRGRERVYEFYNWNNNVNRMIEIYNSLLIEKSLV